MRRWRFTRRCVPSLSTTRPGSKSLARVARRTQRPPAGRVGAAVCDRGRGWRELGIDGSQRGRLHHDGRARRGRVDRRPAPRRLSGGLRRRRSPSRRRGSSSGYPRTRRSRGERGTTATRSRLVRSPRSSSRTASIPATSAHRRAPARATTASSSRTRGTAICPQTPHQSATWATSRMNTAIAPPFLSATRDPSCRG